MGEGKEREKKWWFSFICGEKNIVEKVEMLMNEDASAEKPRQKVPEAEKTAIFF